MILQILQEPCELHWLGDLYSKGTSYSLETKAGGRDIFAWEVSDIEGLDIRLESILCLLIPYNHAFDDASKHGDGAALIFGDADEVGLDF